MTAKKEAVQAYIDRVLAPKIQGDGGWVEFVSLEGDRLTLRFRGSRNQRLLDPAASLAAGRAIEANV